MGFEHGLKSRYWYRPIIFSINISYSGNGSPNIGWYYKVNIILGISCGVTLCCTDTATPIWTWHTNIWKLLKNTRVCRTQYDSIIEVFVLHSCYHMQFLLSPIVCITRDTCLLIRKHRDLLFFPQLIIFLSFKNLFNSSQHDWMYLAFLYLPKLETKKLFIAHTLSSLQIFSLYLQLLMWKGIYGKLTPYYFYHDS